MMETKVREELIMLFIAISNITTTHLSTLAYKSQNFNES